MHQIKLTGIAEIEQPLDRNKNYVIAGEFEETSRTETDAKDGSIITTYKLKPLRLMKLEENGEKVRLKTKNSNSTRLRGAIWHIHQDKHIEMDAEEYYNLFSDKLIKNLDGVLNYLEM